MTDIAPYLVFDMCLRTGVDQWRNFRSRQTTGLETKGSMAHTSFPALGLDNEDNMS